MYLFVVERTKSATVVNGKFRIKQIVCDACRLCILVDTLSCRFIERLAVRRQTEHVFILTGCLANLQASMVRCIIDTEHIDQF